MDESIILPRIDKLVLIYSSFIIMKKVEFIINFWFRWMFEDRPINPDKKYL